VNEFRPHSLKQDQALLSTTPITVVATGIQWGKTSVGAVWLKMQMHTYTAPDDNFIITSPTFPIISQSTLPPFLRVMEGLGTHDKKLNCFRMNGGGTCWFRTGTDPDSVVGIPNVRAILADEAGKYSLYFWENIQGRADPKNAPIMIVTSPYSLNWLYKEIIRPKMKDKAARPDATLIQAASVENPFFNKERYYAREKTMDPRRFKMMYGGGWDRVEGLVYDCFDEVENVCKPFSLPAGTEYYAGVDWGYTNPFAITVRAITPDGYHYQVAEFYRAGLSPSQKVEAAKRLKLTFNIKLFYCDPEEAASIAEFNAAGITSVAADNSVKRGVDLHYELIKSRRFKIFEGSSPYSMDEMEMYHWPEPKDLKIDQDEKDPNPVAQNNHALDSARYITISTVRSLEATEQMRRRQPHVPSDAPKKVEHAVETERLKRPMRAGRTEEWS
jgi:PBSX family phage terminase large subunit